MTPVVLDASAVLALLLDEPGGGRVHAVLDAAVMSVVNLAEIVGHLARGGATETEIHDILDPISITSVDMDSELAYGVGLLLPQTKSAGLSLGDRACLALAKKLNVPAVTADRTWRAITGKIGVAVEIIR